MDEKAFVFIEENKMEEDVKVIDYDLVENEVTNFNNSLYEEVNDNIRISQIIDFTDVVLNMVNYVDIVNVVD